MDHEAMREMRQILERQPENFVLEGFEQARDEVLVLFVEVVDHEPEFRQHYHLKAKVSAMLKLRQTAAQKRAAQIAESHHQEKQQYDRTSRILAILAILISLAMLILKLLGK